MDKFISSDSPERVSLADAYFHFVATSPSERQATIDLSAAIRAEQLGELLSEKVTELRSGDTQSHTTLGVSIPAEALADRTGTVFDWESSKATWEKRQSHFTFEVITVARDRVLAVRPAPAHITKPKRQRSGGLSPRFDWDAVVAQTLALLEEQGWPDIKSRREFAKEICDECAKAGMEPTPGDNTVRDKLSIWLSARKR